MINLNAKHLLVRNKTLGVDDQVDAVLNAVQPNLGLYQKALATYTSGTKRGYFEACLIASQDTTKIAEVLETSVEAVDAYRDFFFNVKDKDKLDLLDIVDQEDDPSRRNMKLWAMSQGLDFIAWRLGKFVSINPVEGLKDMFTLCVYKTKEALFSSNASEASKESTKWAKLSMDLARILKVWVMDSDSARKDIEIALASIDPAFKGYDGIEVLDASSESGTIPGLPGIEGLDNLDSEFPGLPEG